VEVVQVAIDHYDFLDKVCKVTQSVAMPYRRLLSYDLIPCRSTVVSQDYKFEQDVDPVLQVLLPQLNRAPPIEPQRRQIAE
jgi:hypothetical protein